MRRRRLELKLGEANDKLKAALAANQGKAPTAEDGTKFSDVCLTRVGTLPTSLSTRDVTDTVSVMLGGKKISHSWVSACRDSLCRALQKVQEGELVNRVTQVVERIEKESQDASADWMLFDVLHWSDETDMKLRTNLPDTNMKSTKCSAQIEVIRLATEVAFKDISEPLEAILDEEGDFDLVVAADSGEFRLGGETKKQLPPSGFRSELEEYLRELYPLGSKHCASILRWMTKYSKVQTVLKQFMLGLGNVYGEIDDFNSSKRLPKKLYVSLYVAVDRHSSNVSSAPHIRNWFVQLVQHLHDVAAQRLNNGLHEIEVVPLFSMQYCMAHDVDNVGKHSKSSVGVGGPADEVMLGTIVKLLTRHRDKLSIALLRVLNSEMRQQSVDLAKIPWRNSLLQFFDLNDEEEDAYSMLLEQPWSDVPTYSSPKSAQDVRLKLEGQVVGHCVTPTPTRYFTSKPALKKIVTCKLGGDLLKKSLATLQGVFKQEEENKKRLNGAVAWLGDKFLFSRLCPLYCSHALLHRFMAKVIKKDDDSDVSSWLAVRVATGDLGEGVREICQEKLQHLQELLVTSKDITRTDLEIKAEPIVNTILRFSAGSQVRIKRSGHHDIPAARALLLKEAHSGTSAYLDWERSITDFLLSDPAYLDQGFSAVLLAEALAEEQKGEGRGAEHLKSSSVQKLIASTMRRVSECMVNLVAEARHMLTKRSSRGHTSGTRLLVSRASRNTINSLYLKRVVRSDEHIPGNSNFPLFGANVLTEDNLKKHVREGMKKVANTSTPIAVAERSAMNIPIEASDKTIPKPNNNLKGGTSRTPTWLVKLRLSVPEVAKTSDVVVLFMIGDSNCFFFYYCRCWDKCVFLLCELTTGTFGANVVLLPGSNLQWISPEELEHEYESRTGEPITDQTVVRRLHSVTHFHRPCGDIELKVNVNSIEKLNLGDSGWEVLQRMLKRQEEREQQEEQERQRVVDAGLELLEHEMPDTEQEGGEAEPEPQDDLDAEIAMCDETNKAQRAPHGTFVVERTDYYFRTERPEKGEVKTVFYDKILVERPYSFTSKKQFHGGMRQMTFCHLLWARQKLQGRIDEAAMSKLDAGVKKYWNENEIVRLEAEENEGFWAVCLYFDENLPAFLGFDGGRQSDAAHEESLNEIFGVESDQEDVILDGVRGGMIVDGGDDGTFDFAGDIPWGDM